MKTAKQMREVAQARRKRYDKDQIDKGLVRISGWSTKAGRVKLHALRDEILAECK